MVRDISGRKLPAFLAKAERDALKTCKLLYKVELTKRNACVLGAWTAIDYANGRRLGKVHRFTKNGRLKRRMEK